MKRLILITAALVCGVCAWAQNYGEVLSAVESGNNTLKALRDASEAEGLEAHTGIGLTDPQVEVGYLWGSPTDIGNRFDLNVMQSFDFPTVYYWRRKIAEGTADLAQLRYEVERRRVLLEARNVCIDIVYHNALGVELHRRLNSAEKISEVWERKASAGEATSLDVSKASLNLLAARKEIEQNNIELDALREELHHLCGHQTEIEVTADMFEPLMMPADFESWFASARESCPEIAAAASEVELAAEQIKLRGNEWLPRFSAGYKSERIAGTTLQGVGVGISIPLWQNKGKVNATKAREAAAKSEQKDVAARFYCEMNLAYDKAVRLGALAGNYRSTLDAMMPLKDLQKALEGGEIPMVEFILEQNLWYDALRNAITAERDYHKAAAVVLQYR